jgi:hypothetical protein
MVKEPMPMSSRRFRLPVLGATALMTIGLAGCGSGDPNAIKAVPAAGTVTYKGQPIETGTVGFIPAQGRPASGPITNGHFTMTTYTDNDGAIPGHHAVTVNATKQVTGSGRAGDEGRTVSLVPENYAHPDSSGTAVDIPPEGKTDIKIELR